MSLPIKATPVLRGKAAEEFLRRMKEQENIPSYPRDVSKQIAEARKRVLEDYKKENKKRRVEFLTLLFKRFINLLVPDKV